MRRRRGRGSVRGAEEVRKGDIRVEEDGTEGEEDERRKRQSGSVRKARI